MYLVEGFNCRARDVAMRSYIILLGKIPYIANRLRWKSFAKLNCNSLENIRRWMVVLYHQSLLHRLFHWKSVVTNYSTKTTKLFHLEQFAMYDNCSCNCNIKAGSLLSIKLIISRALQRSPEPYIATHNTTIKKYNSYKTK